MNYLNNLFIKSYFTTKFYYAFCIFLSYISVINNTTPTDFLSDALIAMKTGLGLLRYSCDGASGPLKTRGLIIVVLHG